jgi:hypothetical protein
VSDPYPWLVVAPVCGLAADCTVHILVSRIARFKNPYAALLAGMFGGFVVAAVVSAAALRSLSPPPSDVVGYAALILATYLALAWGYFHFVNLWICSLRIRVLHEIVAAGGSMNVARLHAEYNPETIVSLRIDRLCSRGYLIERDGRYYSGRPQFLFVARCFDLIRKVIFGSEYLRRTAGRDLPAK